MEQFSTSMADDGDHMQVVLHAGFSDDHWAALERFYREKLDEGQRHWELDLRRLTYINSMMLGLFVSMNTDVITTGGDLRLVVAQNSMINQLLTLSKLRQIVTVMAI
jgi:anti-anti-sigma factor